MVKCVPRVATLQVISLVPSIVLGSSCIELELMVSPLVEVQSNVQSFIVEVGSRATILI